MSGLTQANSPSAMTILSTRWAVPIDRERVPGVRDHAYTLTPSGERSADTLRHILPALAQRSGRVLICGGGATGCRSHRRICRSVSGSKRSSRHSRRVRDIPWQGGRRVHAPNAVGSGCNGTRPHAHKSSNTQSRLDRRGGIHSVRCVFMDGWIHRSPDCAESGLSVNERGQILIDPYMRAISHPEIYAIGDAASPVRETRRTRPHERLYRRNTGRARRRYLDRCPPPQNACTPRALPTWDKASGWDVTRRLGSITIPTTNPITRILQDAQGTKFVNGSCAFSPTCRASKSGMPGFFYWLGKGRYTAMQRRSHQVESRCWSTFLIDSGCGLYRQWNPSRPIGRYCLASPTACWAV